MSNLQTILITGASSLLMVQLIEKIDTDKYKIYAITRNKSKIKSEKTEVLEGDICDSEFLSHIIKEKKVDIIIHAAALTHSYNTNDYFTINQQGTINLVNAAKWNSTLKFIFISTRVASKQSGEYGYSKLLAEEYVKTNLNNWLIFRLSEIFGGNKNEGIDKLIDTVLRKRIIACPLNVKSKLFPIYSEDVVQVMYDSIFFSQNNNKLITISGKQGFSYYELIKKLSSELNKKMYIIPVPKFLLYTLKNSVNFLKIKIGIVPDQIPRLYSQKEIGQQNGSLSIGEYIKKEKKKTESASKI